MKKIISFALWGTEPFYLDGAINNAIKNKEFYPDWICRFYIDETTVPVEYQKKLKSFDNIEIVNCGHADDVLGMFWRFRPMDDIDVERFIVRDTDCLPTEREVWSVNKWIESGKPFHIIRDNKVHAVTILGGMWGAIPGCIPDFSSKMETFLSNIKETSSQHSKRKYHGADQIFLHQFIWPIIKDNHIAHIRQNENGLKITGKEDFLPVLENEHFIGMPCSIIDGKIVRVESHLLSCNRKEWKYKKICLMVPTYKRIEYLAIFIDSAVSLCDSVNQICFSFCVNEKDQHTIDFLNRYFENTNYEWEIIYENTRQPNLAFYFNKLYSETRFTDAVVSMLGDDMEFKTKGWDTKILSEINNNDGKVLVYCDDDNTAHDKCAVNLFTTRELVNAQNKPFMCEVYHADAIDAIWTMVGMMTGLLKYLPDIIIKHNHMSTVKPELRDETFSRLEPIRQNAREIMSKHAVPYSTLCARNIIEKGIGQWNILQ